jgi:3-oxoacyl-[acyl-carrier-protein] synthase I
LLHLQQSDHVKMPESVKVVEANHPDPLVITAQGMVSSLGLDAATSCAAARAGLRRAQALDCMRFASIDGRSVECAVGHRVPFISHGFEGAPRLARLAAAALRDLTSGFLVSTGARAGFYISMPSCRRPLTGAELIPDRIAKQSFLAEVEDATSGLDDRGWTEKVLSLMRQQVDMAKSISLRFVTHSGHAGFAEALAVAACELQKGEIDLALVGGLDSLADERSLKWLKLTGRLKSEANPAGLEPGEASVFLAVERRLTARKSSPPLSQIRTIATAEENRPRILGQQPRGKALSACIISAIGAAANPWLLTDHNGESNRATEFGNALTRIRRLPPAILPARSFGDTGAASGGLAACLAQSAFLRSYAPADTAVIASMADGEQRSAFSIEQG